MVASFVVLPPSCPRCGSMWSDQHQQPINEPDKASNERMSAKMHLLLLEEPGRLLWLAIAASSSATNALVMDADVTTCKDFICGFDRGRVALPILHSSMAHHLSWDTHEQTSLSPGDAIAPMHQGRTWLAWPRHLSSSNMYFCQ